MLGFPLVSSEKFIILLISNGFTVATIDQVTPPPEPERKCTNVFSPSTFIGTTPDINTSYAVCLYFDYEAQNKLKKKFVSVNGEINGVNGGINGVNGGINRINRDYATFDQEVISRTNYLLQNKK